MAAVVAALLRLLQLLLLLRLLRLQLRRLQRLRRLRRLRRPRVATKDGCEVGGGRAGGGGNSEMRCIRLRSSASELCGMVPRATAPSRRRHALVCA